MQDLIRSHFILYVADQQRSTQFYAAVLGIEPALNVPGMTEFHLAGNVVIGLMPAAGASRLLGIVSDELNAARIAPRAEVYLVVNEPAVYHARAIVAGGHEASPLSARDWGHEAAYSYDPDGHVLAFAKEI